MLQIPLKGFSERAGPTRLRTASVLRRFCVKSWNLPGIKLNSTWVWNYQQTNPIPNKKKCSQITEVLVYICVLKRSSTFLCSQARWRQHHYVDFRKTTLDQVCLVQTKVCFLMMVCSSELVSEPENWSTCKIIVSKQEKCLRGKPPGIRRRWYWQAVHTSKSDWDIRNCKWHCSSSDDGSYPIIKNMEEQQKICSQKAFIWYIWQLFICRFINKTQKIKHGTDV